MKRILIPVLLLIVIALTACGSSPSMSKLAKEIDSHARPIAQENFDRVVAQSPNEKVGEAEFIYATYSEEMEQYHVIYMCKWFFEEDGEAWIIEDMKLNSKTYEVIDEATQYYGMEKEYETLKKNIPNEEVINTTTYTNVNNLK